MTADDGRPGGDRRSSGISLHEAILVDIDDPYAPPTDVLRVNVIGDSVSLTISKHTQDAKSSTYTDLAEVCVDVHTLRQVLAVAVGDDQRNRVRPESDPCYRGLVTAWRQVL